MKRLDRIAQVYEPISGGVPRYARTLSEKINQGGRYQSTTFSPDPLADEQICLSRSMKSVSLYRTEIEEIFEQYDLIHFHSYFALRWAFVRAGLGSMTTPFIFQPHALPTACLLYTSDAADE